MLYDLIIIGGGPGGVGAGVYSARKKIKTLVIAKEIGGQSIVSDNIQNWIGTTSISGVNLGKSLKNHLFSYKSEEFVIKEGEFVDKIIKKDEKFLVKTNKGEYETRTILITTGSRRKKLSVPGADKFENKGVTYCASCDGPLFTDMDVAVIGGGNSGFESAAQLLAYVKSVTLLDYGEKFKADTITVEKVTANPKMKAVNNAEILEVLGDTFVTGIKYKDRKTGVESEIKVNGIFVEIGAVPSTEFAKDLVKINSYGQIITDPRNQQTSEKGIWSAGDCTDVLYHQNNIAVGDAVKALEDIYIWLQKN